MKRKGIFAMFALSLLMALGAAVVAMSWMQEQGGDDEFADVSQVVVARSRCLSAPRWRPPISR